jgi:ubiquinone/menaquinone biosynthesis C-methylase UbiE
MPESMHHVSSPGTRIALVNRMSSTIVPAPASESAVVIGAEWTHAEWSETERLLAGVAEGKAQTVTLLAGHEGSAWHAPGTTTWWEFQLLERGFRKSTTTPGTPTRLQRAADGTVARHPVIFERLDAATLAAYPLAALKEERNLHMDMLREAGPRSDAHLARYRWACRFLARGASVVDAACGLGYGAAIMADVTASRVLAIDESAYAIDYGRTLWGTTRPQTEFHRGDVRVVPASDCSVDLVVSMETLEHLADDGPLLKEFRRVLKPGGLLTGSVPNLWVDETGKDPNPYHFQVFDRERLFAVLSPYFEVIELWQQNAATDDTQGHSVAPIFQQIDLDGTGNTGKPEWLVFAARRR